MVKIRIGIGISTSQLSNTKLSLSNGGPKYVYLRSKSLSVMVMSERLLKLVPFLYFRVITGRLLSSCIRQAAIRATWLVITPE
jgi:hypothetical protein